MSESSYEIILTLKCKGIPTDHPDLPDAAEIVARTAMKSAVGSLDPKREATPVSCRVTYRGSKWIQT